MIPAVTGPLAAERMSMASELRAMTGGAVETLSSAENVSMDALTGEASTREVVDAVMEAERTVRLASAMRDKVVAAWLDLSRMSI